MNGPPVSPAQKSENAPTWRPRKHNFRAYFWPHFPPFLSSTKYQTPNLQLLI